MTYRSAVKLLSGLNPGAARRLDQAFGGVLLSEGPWPDGARAWFDTKNEVLEHSRKLAGAAAASLRGMAVPAGARTVRAVWILLATAALYEELSAALTPQGPPDVTMQIPLRTFVDSGGIPVPAPGEPFASALQRLSAYFGDTGDLAAERFARALHQLAGEYPAFSVWFNLDQTDAVMRRVGEVETALGGVRLMLDSMRDALVAADRAAAKRWQQSLTRQYRADLAKPLADLGEGWVAPSAADGYLNPRYRVTLAGGKDCRPSAESWWDYLEIRHDLQQLLGGHLLTQEATAGPLLILGHPGAGKSMLTRVLAAQLPPELYSPVRVALREVAASSRILAQIEEALHQTIHERVQWPEFVDSLNGALPVVMLDGFDELIQATGASRSDYLEQVQAFQEAEAAQGRPVAVLVTSRTAVADRARIPDGSSIIKLEPFDEAQVLTWIGNWNRINATRIDPAAVLVHRDLAVQPILLLMLALYESATGGLRPGGETLTSTALYERLLTSFVEREVTKEGKLDAPQLAARVESELYRLSVVAFAMFNRGAQIVHESDLEADFRGLEMAPAQPAAVTEGFHSGLSLAQLTLGRFFFVHRNEAKEAAQGETVGRGFEFLHATFGEFLIARCTLTVMKSVARQEKPATPWQAAEPPRQDPLLRALLSFQAFTKRRRVVEFLLEMARGLPDHEREPLARLGGNLLSQCMHDERDSRYGGYQPVAVDQPHRFAHYSFNLCLVFLACKGELTDVDEIGPWQKWSRLWHSQLDRDAWDEAAMQLDIDLRGDRYVVGLDTPPEPKPELPWERARIIWWPDGPHTELRARRLLLDRAGGSAMATIGWLEPGLSIGTVDTARTDLPASPWQEVPGVYSAVLPLVALATGQIEPERVRSAMRLVSTYPVRDTRLDTLLLQCALRYGALLDDDTVSRVCPAEGFDAKTSDDLDLLIAYVRVVLDRIRRSPDTRWRLPVIDPEAEAYRRHPAKYLELVLLREKVKAHRPGDFLLLLGRVDLAQLSHEAPETVVAVLEYLAKRRSRFGAWLDGNLAGVVRGLSPYASWLLDLGDLIP